MNFLFFYSHFLNFFYFEMRLGQPVRFSRDVHWLGHVNENNTIKCILYPEGGSVVIGSAVENKTIWSIDFRKHADHSTGHFL